VDELITATSEVQGKLSFAKQILQFVQQRLNCARAVP